MVSFGFGASSAAARAKARRATAGGGQGSPSGGSPGRSPRGEPGSPDGTPSPGRSPTKGGHSAKEWENVTEGPTPWIHGNRGSAVFAVAVVANSVFIGIDTDLRAKGGDKHSMANLMLAVEIMFQLLFSVELVLRLLADRCPGYAKDPWNYLDLFLVLFGFADIGMALSQSDQSEFAWMSSLRMLKNMRMFRMLRMLRVLKVVRLLRLLRELILLGQAIIGALRSLFWVALMFVMICYMSSVLLTEFWGIPNKDDEFLDEHFGDVGKTMFTMIQLATLEGWSDIARYVNEVLGGIWVLPLLVYVIFTNCILLNVVLAVLIEKIFDLTAQVKDPENGDKESWMSTPRSMKSEESDDRGEKEDDNPLSALAGGGGGGGPGQSIADRLALQVLSELFDTASIYVGQEGVDQRKLVTLKSLKKCLDRQDQQTKLFAVIPAMKDLEIEQLSQRIWDLCPVRNDKEGLNRQELSEACMTIRGEISMNNLVVISQTLQRMDKAVHHELVHLNKHQRRLNRRFLKLRHRLRKVYHFDGAPRKMVALVNELKAKQRKARGEDTHGSFAAGSKSQGEGALQDEGSEGSSGTMSDIHSQESDNDW